MADPRLVTSSVTAANGAIINVVTYQRDDQNFDGIWSHNSNAPLLVFSGIEFTDSTIKRYDGPIAGALHGHPLYLLYWGSWWNAQAGQDRRDLLEPEMKGMLESVYFDQLKQYGISHAPNWAGSLVVTRPEPPIYGSVEGISGKILHLIDDLVNDNALPNPDEPKPLYMVMMPDTFTLNEPGPGIDLGLTRPNQKTMAYWRPSTPGIGQAGPARDQQTRSKRCKPSVTRSSRR